MVFADTSVWVDFLRGTNSPEAQTLRRLIGGDETIVINGMVCAEILLGVKDDAEAARIGGLLDAFDYAAELSRADYAAAAKIYRDCRARGYTIRSTIDCLIARVCVRDGYVLLNKDRDFAAIAKVTPLKLLAS
jgi:predicted nucleic acid-binding protein